MSDFHHDVVWVNDTDVSDGSAEELESNYEHGDSDGESDEGWDGGCQ